MKMPNIQDIISKFRQGLDKNTKIKIYVAALFLCLAAVVLTSLKPFSSTKDETTKALDTKTDCSQLNDQLAALIGKINGAGRVKVMITFDASDENVYAKDTDEEFENNESSPIEQRMKSEYIIIKGSDGEEGLKIKNVYPTVRGVAVVCDGANDPNVKGQIVSVVSALFDINSTRISVAEMAKQEE